MTFLNNVSLDSIQVEVYKKLGFSTVGEPEVYKSAVNDFKIWIMSKTKPEHDANPF